MTAVDGSAVARGPALLSRVPEQVWWIARRTARSVGVLLVVTFVVFLQVRNLPGDPAIAVAGESATPEQLALVREDLGLEEPVRPQFATWLGGIATGDFGRSYVSDLPVRALLQQRLPVSLQLMGTSLLISIGVAIPLGLWSGYRVGRVTDRWISRLTVLLLSTPSFALGVVFVLVFAVKLGTFPASGFTRLSENWVDSLRSTLLPAVTLASTPIALLVKTLRAEVITTLQQDYIAFARAKGLSPVHILFRVALRPSLLPFVTVAGLSAGYLLGGSIVVEAVFGLPGMGTLLVSAVNNRDYVTIQSVVALIATAYVVINLLVDLLYGALDPRAADTPQS